MTAALHALLSHWRRRPLQLIALLSGLMIATALWSGVQALNAQARDSYDRAAALLGGDRVESLARPDGTRFGVELFAAMRRAGWAVSPVLEGRVRVAETSLRVIGIEPLTLPAASGMASGVSEGDGFQGFIAPPYRGLVARETLARLEPGGATATETGTPVPPLQAVEDLAPGVLIVDIAAAEQLLGVTAEISRLLLDPAAEAPGALPRVAEEAGLERSAPNDAAGDLDRLTDSFHLNLTAFGLLAFLVGLFIVHSAISLAFEQRLPVLRTLRACGVSARLLTAVLLAELLLFATFAGMLGVGLGYVIAATLMPDVAASLRGLYGATVSGSLTLDPAWWGQGVAMSVLGALAASAYSLARALRMPPLASAQRFAWREAQVVWLRWQGILAAALLIAAALLMGLGNSLVAGFAALAALLLGGALILPPALAAVLRRGEAMAKGPLSQWFWADSRLQLSGLSMALMALLLALSANIGVGTMVDGFRKTFTGWLDNRLIAEIYLNTNDDAQATRIESWLATRGDVDAVLPTLRAEIRLYGWPATIVGFRDHASYRDHWPMVETAPDIWDRLGEGDGAVISEQFARRLGVGIGDTLALQGWSPEIVGIYPDYGNPKGQISANIDAVRRAYPDAARGGYGLRTAPENSAPLMTALREEFGLGERSLIDQAALKSFSTGVFEKTFAVTAALNVLTMLVAGFAMFMSLLTLAEMRLPQVAPLWATGVTRRRLAALELTKTVALALLTSILAVPLGLAVAWCLVAVVNVQAFGWRLPLHLFPAQWLALIALALVTALLAAALPALRLARTRPARLLRVFADER